MPVRSPEALWETALGQLELQVTRPNYETWLRNTVGLTLDDNQLIVGVPSDFASEWLRSRLSGLINRTVTQLADADISVLFQILGAPAAPPAPSANGRQPAPVPAAARPVPDLDPNLTFSSFTVVKSNRLAYRAASRVASGKVPFDPLVLVGPPGLGKTHLLHAIGHQALAADKHVIALTSEAFVNKYSSASRDGHPHTFRQLFEDCDLLLLDDLPFLASRAASQEQFFHVFNTLHAANARVVITSDLLPDSVTGLSSRLRSRLKGGLTTEVQPPSPTDRLDILKAKASHLPQTVPEDILRYIANQPYSSVRELEGALNRVTAYADFSDAPLSLDSVTHILHPFTTRHTPSATVILDTVCRHFSVSLDQLKGPSRSREITFARHIAMYLLRNYGPRPLTNIGQLLGGRDHSTVLTAYRRIKKERSSLPQTQSHLDAIEASLRRDSAA